MEGLASHEDLRRGQRVRQMGVVLLGLFILCGAVGVFGVRSGTAKETAGGTELSVTYARVTRPGLDTPWGFEVHRDGGFSESIVVRTTASYFDLFDENGLDPEPASVEQDGTWIVWTFDPPKGETLVVDFDARISPATQSGTKATTEIVAPQDGPKVTYRTWVMP